MPILKNSSNIVCVQTFWFRLNKLQLNQIICSLVVEIIIGKQRVEHKKNSTTFEKLSNLNFAIKYFRVTVTV